MLIFVTLTVTVPILVPNSPATIANDAVSAAAPPNAITIRSTKQNTTKTTPLGSIDTNLKCKAINKQKVVLKQKYMAVQIIHRLFMII